MHGQHGRAPTKGLVTSLPVNVELKIDKKEGYSLTNGLKLDLEQPNSRSKK